MEYTEKVLLERVEELMKKHSTTQQQLAQALGIPQQRISESLRGVRRISVAELCRISNYYQVSPAELLAPAGVLFTEGL